jgi:fructosamine-3-kinase
MPVPSPIQIAIKEKLVTHGADTGKLCFSAVSGGNINETYRIESNGVFFFCKVNSATKFPHLFERESGGLRFIQQQGVITTPEVLDYFVFEDKQILILKWIDEGPRTADFWKNFGEQLAALHTVSNTSFGLQEDNYMGSVPQSNKVHTTWTSFFREQRLMPLVALCAEKNLLSSTLQHQFDTLYLQLHHVFDDAQKPALLHGDLWSGNFLCNQQAQPVLIDPAIYFGHPAVDLGMTTLFGGFNQRFYDAYKYHLPLPHNYKEQWQICNLYPLLIHLYLFGKSYVQQIEQTLARYL